MSRTEHAEKMMKSLRETSWAIEETSAYLKEVHNELQNMCPHEFKANGYCSICGCAKKDALTEIKVKYFDPEMPRLEEITYGDWIDLVSIEDIEYTAYDFFMIDLGVAMELPAGYEAHIAPRSSTYKNYGLLQTNSIGVIDNDYSGPGDMWKMPVLTLRDGYIEKYDRVCQFRIVPVMEAVGFTESDLTHNEDRGGLGHTGRQ